MPVFSSLLLDVYAVPFVWQGNRVLSVVALHICIYYYHYYYGYYRVMMMIV